MYSIYIKNTKNISRKGKNIKRKKKKNIKRGGNIKKKEKKEKEKKREEKKGKIAAIRLLGI